LAVVVRRTNLGKSTSKCKVLQESPAWHRFIYALDCDCILLKGISADLKCSYKVLEIDGFRLRDYINVCANV